ncbi:MAG: hypothetical protein M1825_006080 [Sarcosagium campestre]|nr:MAG: hypothetical protein M1825_006080 [Sarcosagium campestre]
MAEIGLIASVIGIAGAGAKLSVTLYTFAETASSAERSIRGIANDVSLTSSVLEQLGSHLSEDEHLKLCSDNARTKTQEICGECERVFEEINEALGKSVAKISDGAAKSQKLLQSLKWPFQEKKMELLRSNLDRLKSTLLLMLKVLTYGRMIKSSSDDRKSTDIDRQQIASLVRSNEEANKRFQLLMRAIESDKPSLSDQCQPSENTGGLEKDIEKDPPPFISATVFPPRQDYPGAASRKRINDLVRSIQRMLRNIDETTTLMEIADCVQTRIDSLQSRMDSEGEEMSLPYQMRIPVVMDSSLNRMGSEETASAYTYVEEDRLHRLKASESPLQGTTQQQQQRPQQRPRKSSPGGTKPHSDNSLNVAAESCSISSSHGRANDEASRPTSATADESEPDRTAVENSGAESQDESMQQSLREQAERRKSKQRSSESSSTRTWSQLRNVLGTRGTTQGTTRRKSGRTDIDTREEEEAAAAAAATQRRESNSMRLLISTGPRPPKTRVETAPPRSAEYIKDAEVVEVVKITRSGSKSPQPHLQCDPVTRPKTDERRPIGRPQNIRRIRKAPPPPRSPSTSRTAAVAEVDNPPSSEPSVDLLERLRSRNPMQNSEERAASLSTRRSAPRKSVERRYSDVSSPAYSPDSVRSTHGYALDDDDDDNDDNDDAVVKRLLGEWTTLYV